MSWTAALEFGVGIWNYFDTPDFTEQDRIIIQKYMDLGQNIPALDVEDQFPGILPVFAKLAAHGYEPAEAKLEEVKFELPTEKMQAWDSAIANLREMATTGVTGAERAGIQEAAENLSQVFTGQQAQAEEMAARRGIRGPATTLAGQRGTAQGAATAGKAMGREIMQGMAGRKERATGQLVQATQNQYSQMAGDEIDMRKYIAETNLKIAGAKTRASEFFARSKTRRDEAHRRDERDDARYRIESQYKAGRTNQAISNQAAQWTHGAKERALAGEAQARQNLTRNQMAQTRGEQAQRAAIAGGAESGFDALGDVYDDLKDLWPSGGSSDPVDPGPDRDRGPQ